MHFGLAPQLQCPTSTIVIKLELHIASGRGGMATPEEFDGYKLNFRGEAIILTRENYCAKFGRCCCERKRIWEVEYGS